MYYFNFEEFEIIGSSPEMIVKQKDNKVLTCPIAGTRPRGKDDAEDQKFAEGLMKDPKDKRLHAYSEIFPCYAHRFAGRRKKKRRISST